MKHYEKPKLEIVWMGGGKDIMTISAYDNDALDIDW